MRPVFRYILPCSLLYLASRVLRPAEQASFVTGIKLGKNTIILTQLVRVKGDRSGIHVAPAPAAVSRAHQRLLAFGQDIEAQFHSHPGLGRQATYPSRTDLATARRWENGAPFLGGIFSADGRYVRFFNHNQRSTVQVYGAGYTQEDDDLFRLDLLSVPAPPVTVRVTDGAAGTPAVVEPGPNQQE